ncbi:skin secretory protein xP2-like [Balaenoptera acutorostrata]|uniref:Skin secretory protein xP2-like n=1 Tax=Balaenoptera acutorostrata TaxID=9767 RepID=A0A452CAI5_BALAC|nr:skin secretory protein xP2-like [Balaenoptera acutorostrata]
MRKRPVLGDAQPEQPGQASPAPQGPLESRVPSGARSASGGPPAAPRGPALQPHKGGSGGPAAAERSAWQPGSWRLPPPLQVPSEGPGMKGLQGVRPASPPGGPARPAPLQGRLRSLEVLRTFPQEPETLCSASKKRSFCPQPHAAPESVPQTLIQEQARGGGGGVVPGPQRDNTRGVRPAPTASLGIHVWGLARPMAAASRGIELRAGASIFAAETLLSGHGRWGDWAGDGDPGRQSLEPSLDEWVGEDHASEGTGPPHGAEGGLLPLSPPALSPILEAGRSPASASGGAPAPAVPGAGGLMLCPRSPCPLPSLEQPRRGSCPARAARGRRVAPPQSPGSSVSPTPLSQPSSTPGRSQDNREEP